MTTRNFIRLRPSEVPIKFQPEVDGKRFLWSCKYNSYFDRYTVEISDAAGNLVYTTKLVIGDDMFHAGITLELTSEVVPRDLVDGESAAVTSSTLDGLAKLYVEAAA